MCGDNNDSCLDTIFFNLAANLTHNEIKHEEENSFTIQFQHPLLYLLASETLNKTAGHGWQELIKERHTLNTKLDRWREYDEAQK